MSSIESAFIAAEQNNSKAFIPFIVAGHPSLDMTEQLIYTLRDAGSSIIELGIPFSDPIADGPVIYRANQETLAQGVSLPKIFSMLRRVRKKSSVALVLLLYANTIFAYKIENFFKTAKELSIAGVIIPDLPLEEKQEFAQSAARHGVTIISLVAPSSGDRIKTICQDAQGFLYCISSLGVTGARDSVLQHLSSMFSEINQHCQIPTALGFGISTPEQIRDIKAYAKGFIVGSALVKIIEEHRYEAIEPVRDFARSMIQACKL